MGVWMGIGGFWQTGNVPKEANFLWSPMTAHLLGTPIFSAPDDTGEIRENAGLIACNFFAQRNRAHIQMK